MFPHEWTMALVGGALLGAAGVMLMHFNGRIFGVSGIVAGTLAPKTGDAAWRFATVVGLLLGGLALTIFYPEAFDRGESRTIGTSIIAGLLVGLGTRFGNGCTSGHGICGIGRLSKRSLAGTATFLLTGMLTASLLGLFKEGP